MRLRIARVVQTSTGRPAQWDAWTTDGQYLHLRYRSGYGTVHAQPSPNPDTWDLDQPPLVEWDDHTASGDITLDDFLATAGMELDPCST